jgi:RNA polymerase-binding transcription factor DksA
METELADEDSPTEAAPQPATTATVESARGVGVSIGEALAPELSIDEVDRLLDDVEAALTRLDDGTYGRCGACGSVIDDSRLAAAPTVQTCANCAAVPADD